VVESVIFPFDCIHLPKRRCRQQLILNAEIASIEGLLLQLAG
jgi:hypothetical protein